MPPLSPQSVDLAPQDIVLAIASGAGGPYPLDAIRIMKGCFLACHLGAEEWHDLFDFQPYDYGPFDSGVYRARDELVRDQLLLADRSQRYPSFEVTTAGAERISALESTFGSEAVAWLQSLGAYVTSLSFRDLITEVYAKFPEYATASRFRQS